MTDTWEQMTTPTNENSGLESSGRVGVGFRILKRAQPLPETHD